MGMKKLIILTLALSSMAGCAGNRQLHNYRVDHEVDHRLYYDRHAELEKEKMTALIKALKNHRHEHEHFMKPKKEPETKQ